jgi:FkbM family methyltransferase
MFYTKLQKQLEEIDRKINLLSKDVEFIRTRTSIYLGDGIALTYLVDETPIYITSNDFGVPFNFINGGLYEPDNLDVLMSFVRDDTIFLDIGANLGFFSLQIARRIFQYGKVHAFEPHPDLAELLKRSAFVNGFGQLGLGKGVITCHNFGLSDCSAQLDFCYPAEYLGGGGYVAGASASTPGTVIKAEVKRLDDVFDSDFTCDLVKIDVEGHEVNVLHGMQNIVSRSQHIKILFEKLVPNAGYESEIESLLGAFGFELYGVLPNASLQKILPGTLTEWAGYVLATRNGELGSAGLIRTGFSIYPRQLCTIGENLQSLSRDKLIATGASGQILCHGPYWFLRSGIYHFRLHGEIEGHVSVVIAARFGHPVQQFEMETGEHEKTFVVERDLVGFECIIRAKGTIPSIIRIERLEFCRVG